MTELEKKQSGEFYDTRDAQIRTAHNKAKELMKKYNDIPASEAEEREMLLRTMPVSYTHLYVYKRQALDASQRAAGGGIAV